MFLVTAGLSTREVPGFESSLARFPGFTLEVSKPGNSTFQGSKPWKLQVSRFPRLESPGFKGPNLGTSTFGGPKPWNLNVWEVQTLEPQRLGGPKLGTSMIGGPKPWNRNVWGSRPWNLNPKSGHSRFERLPGFSLLFPQTVKVWRHRREWPWQPRARCNA